MEKLLKRLKTKYLVYNFRVIILLACEHASSGKIF